MKAVNSLRQKYTDGINWVAPENYQITFFFLVEISTKQVAKKNINETLSGLSCQKKIIIGKPEFIPRVNPRLFWLSVAPIDKQLYIKWDKMRELMQAEGFSVYYGDLKMHITLARIKKRLPGYLEAHFLTTELKKV